MSYLQSEDITANVATGFDLEPYLIEADGEINDQAEKLGVRTTSDIETNPLHYKIKRYGVAYVLLRVTQDKIGTNNPEISDQDKYLSLYEVYRRELESLRPQLSYEMFTGQIDEIRDRANSTGILYRQ